ncbi:MAG: hypothetical protein ABEJ25_00465 [Candidatus Bipolaricaulia bacterium]
MDYKSKLSVFVLVFLSVPILISPPVVGSTNFNLGVEISGHLIPYFGLSQTVGNREAGVNLGVALPHDLFGSNILDYGYQGTIYYRYAFVNTNFYPGIQTKVLFSPPSAKESEFLLMIGGGLEYLDYIGGFRLGGGLQLNLGLPVSALEGFVGPIPCLSLESSYEFG